MLPHRQVVLFSLLALCLASLLLSAESLSQSIDQTKIKIGVSTPLTGDAASYGTDVLKVLKFANHKLANDRYEFVVEDDNCDGKRAVSIAHSFIQRNIKWVLGVVCSGALSAAAPVYEKGRVVTISPSANMEGISSGGRFSFTTMVDDRIAMPVLAGHISTRHKHVAVLSEQTEMAQQMADAFRVKAEELRMRVQMEEFTPSSRDFKTQLLRIKSHGSSALFLNTQSEATFSAALRQIRELNLPFALYGAFFPGTAEFLKNSASLADGIDFVDLPDLTSGVNEEGRDLYAQFKNEVGPVQSIEFMFATTFESFRVLHQALQSQQPVAEFLSNRTFPGLFGNYSFAANGTVDGVRHQIKTIRGGAVHPVPSPATS